MKIRSFIKNNIITIVMVPAIIGMHFAWDSLQSNEDFVQKHEKKDLPIVIGYNYVKDEIREKISSLQKKLE